jgi:methylated-DNA-[protein]-cysteine S-methyltransferase
MSEENHVLDTQTTTTRATVDSPIGPITLVAAAGALTGLHMHEQRHPPQLAADCMDDPSAFGDVSAQLAAYFRGELFDFDVPLALRGTPFQLRVWAALQEIPYGETVSYGELAARIGQPGAARAVGLANGRNPIGIIVPCHRVIGADGRLTGYGGGLPRKQQLLSLERRYASAAPALF